MSKNKKIKYSAPFVVHWPTGPTETCAYHRDSLVGLGNFMGSHIAVTVNLDETKECQNCINEAKESD